MYVQLVLIVETIVLFLLTTILRGKKLAFIISLVILAAGSIAVIQNIPLFQTMIVQVFGLLSGTRYIL